MSIKFIKKYSFAHRGLDIEHFEPGQTVEKPSEELVKTATTDGVIETGEVDESGQTEETKPEPKKTKVKA